MSKSVVGVNQCPKCGENAMPPIRQESMADARACQKCGFVQDIVKVDGERRPVVLEVAGG